MEQLKQSINLHNVNKIYVLGHNNNIIKQLEEELKIKCESINGEIKLLSENKKKLELAVSIINEFIKKAEGRKKHFKQSEINDIFSKFSDEEDKKVIWQKKVTQFNSAQKEVIESFDSNKILVLHGQAGTGKSFIGVYLAVMNLLNKKYNKIILTRPIMESGDESLGYLPGEVEDKILPYMIPFYESFKYLLSPNKVANWIQNGTIEVVPLAYMRGRNFYGDTIIIMDEAQNCREKSMLLFLTRLCDGAKIIINGDETQSDLHKQEGSGLKKVLNTLKDIEQIKFIEFTDKDIMRDNIINQILEKWNNIEPS